jgi:arylsulfatase A-like enzyme
MSFQQYQIYVHNQWLQQNYSERQQQYGGKHDDEDYDYEYDFQDANTYQHSLFSTGQSVADDDECTPLKVSRTVPLQTNDVIQEYLRHSSKINSNKRNIRQQKPSEPSFLYRIGQWTLSSVLASIVIILFLSSYENRETAFVVGNDDTGSVAATNDDTSVLAATDDNDDTSSILTAPKPHIIFVLADDLGWNSMGYENYDLNFTTPFLSDLASKGIIMDNYYAQEMCSPSRASLLTGRYPLTIGMQYSMINPTTSFGLSTDETLLPEVLRENGYATHMLGKWHLGHYSPLLLPTARGFDHFSGYLSGETFYWSKKNPDHSLFTDMLDMNTSCYFPYLDDDLHTYSTHLYRNKAVDIISDHDSEVPLFLYLSFQAVHDPFTDLTRFQKGVPKELLPDGVYDIIHSQVDGHKRRQYAMSLSVFDAAMEDIYNALGDKGILDNSYIIFASDNGGCFLSGGKNGPLRGTKGALFDGGLKVDSFIYSPLISKSSQGMRYSKLMHVSDWFPTILDLASISYEPEESKILDGVSHVSAWLDGSEETPRDYVLYNYYYGIGSMGLDKWTNGSFAIRNEKYKLMHTYDSPIYGKWFEPGTLIENDDSLSEGVCNTNLASSGEFTYFLFDMEKDPYETDNIYNSTSSDVEDAKTELYAVLEKYAANAKNMVGDEQAVNDATLAAWKQHNYYIVPWVAEADLEPALGHFPRSCYEESEMTFHPTQKPVGSPSAHPHQVPTRSKQPTLMPTKAPSAKRKHDDDDDDDDRAGDDGDDHDDYWDDDADDDTNET